NRIITSLKAISGVSDSTAEAIIENRPYASFEDFYERMYETKQIQKSQVIQLIKAGVFNEFGSQVDIMKKFIVGEVDVKETLNGQNMSRIVALGLLQNDELIQYQDFYNFRVYLKQQPVYRKTLKPKNMYYTLSEEYAISYFNNQFSDDMVDEIRPDSSLIVNGKEFDKEYKKRMAPLMEIIQTEEFVRRFNNYQFLELYQELASGSISKWHMDSVSFYADSHELAVVDKKRYGIVDFNSLPKEPVPVSQYVGRDGRIRYQYGTETIAGTVVDKNKNKHTVSLLTESGVVTVKLFGN